MSSKSVEQLAKKLANAAMSSTPKQGKQTQPPKKPKAGRKARARKRANAAGLGTMRLRDKELLFSVTADGTQKAYPSWKTGTGNLQPPVLSKLQGMFSRIRWHSLKVWWVGTTGMTVGGSVILAWDKSGTYDAQSTLPERQQVAGTQPNVVVAGWENAVRQPLILSGAALQGAVGTGWYQKGAAFSDAFPAMLLVNTSGGAKGDVWIEYDVSLSGLMP